MLVPFFLGGGGGIFKSFQVISLLSGDPRTVLLIGNKKKLNGFFLTLKVVLTAI